MTTDLVVTITDELVSELESANGRALPEISASIIRALIAEREELKDEIEWLEDQNEELAIKNGAYVGMASALLRSDKLLTEARREIAELKRDAERLNKLDKLGTAYGFENELHGYYWDISGPFATVRDAIDAIPADQAMQERQK